MMVVLGFYILTAAAIGMVLLLFSNTKKQLLTTIIPFSLIWIGYILTLTQLGVLRSFDFPPRVPLFIILPIISIILVFLNRPFVSNALLKIPIQIPVLMQSFRIVVELLLYAAYRQGIVPQRATFEGLNFDILVGISAIPMSLGIKKEIIAKKGVFIWNIGAMCILFLTVYSFISTYYFTDFGETPNGLKFVEFPYVLVASTLLPIAIFLHVFSLKQLIKK